MGPRAVKSRCETSMKLFSATGGRVSGEQVSTHHGANNKSSNAVRVYTIEWGILKGNFITFRTGGIVPESCIPLMECPSHFIWELSRPSLKEFQGENPTFCRVMSHNWLIWSGFGKKNLKIIHVCFFCWPYSLYTCIIYYMNESIILGFKEMCGNVNMNNQHHLGASLTWRNAHW